MMIPLINAAIGTISKSFRKYAMTIPGNHEVRELQKTAILGHCTQTAEQSIECCGWACCV
jgi:hypothetical protein